MNPSYPGVDSMGIGPIAPFPSPWWWSSWCRKIHGKRQQLLAEVQQARGDLNDQIDRREALAHRAADALSAIKATMPTNLPQVFDEAKRMEKLIRHRQAERVVEEEEERKRQPGEKGHPAATPPSDPPKEGNG